jgi:hypothetical protein
MRYIDKALAFKIESCIKQTHIQMSSKGHILEVDDGAACFSGKDSFFSQVIGFGFHTKPRYFKAQIQAIEKFYQELGHHQIDIEICPLVGAELLQFLSLRGYVITEVNSVSYLDLNDYKPSPKNSNFDIQVLNKEQNEHWAKTIALGFGVLNAQTQFNDYAKIDAVSTFGVYSQNVMVAGASLAVHDDVCDLAVTSTLPEFRGRGLQKNLIEYRLRQAKTLQLALAVVTTTPGSISNLNVQKIGFISAYTRIKLSYDMSRV